MAEYRQLVATYARLTVVVQNALVEREDVREQIIAHPEYPGDAPRSSATDMAIAVAARLGLPAPASVMQTRPRDETGYWTNLECVEDMVRGFLQAASEHPEVSP